MVQRSFAAFLFLVVASPMAPAQTFEARLRQLEKEIAAVRGLEFKAPVQGKIISRPADASKALQGYYVPRDKTLYFYDDLAGNYQKGVLVHEMVHALQDQHFDLEKLRVDLHKQDEANDRAMALAALIEGDATLTMIELLKNEQPKVAAMLDVPLEKARNLQNAFLYAQGARYVKALKDKGGWSSVNAAYRFPPRSTASILNFGGVSVIDLGPGKTLGPLALLKKLLNDQATAHDAMKLARSWRGDNRHTSAAGSTTVFACQDVQHAALLAHALSKLHSGEHARALVLHKTRVHLYDAASPAALEQLRDEAEGPLAVKIHSRKRGGPISFGDMASELLGADVVCIGENHDSDIDHRLQLQVIKALHAQDERLGVGLEMFQKPFQKAIGRFFKSEITEEVFLKESEYQERWGYDWSLYRPIVEFCRRNQLPLVALNAPKELTRRISQVGIAALSAAEKNDLGLIDLDVKEHRAHWYELLAKMHGNPKASADQKERSYQVMATWDDYMARTAVDFQQKNQLRRFVILAGSGHVERGFGIPQRAGRYSGGKVLTIGSAAKVTEVLTDYQVRTR